MKLYLLQQCYVLWYLCEHTQPNANNSEALTQWLIKALNLWLHSEDECELWGMS